MAVRFKGIFPALVTPFRGEDIALDGFRDNIGRYNAFDLAGYVVLGSTGECVFLSDDEAAGLVETAKRAAAPGRAVIAGTARESTGATVAFTNRVAGLGVDAALVRAPSYYKSKMTREVLRRHYLEVADKARVPVIVYNVPQNTGFGIDPGLVVELSAHPNIVGLKDSSGSLAYLGEVLPRVGPDFSYFVGSGFVILPGLVMGASGAILAVANAAPAACALIYKLFLEGKIKEAAAVQLRLMALNKTVMETYGIAGLKYAMDAQGFHGGEVRTPLLPIDEKAKAEISAMLEKLGSAR